MGAKYIEVSKVKGIAPNKKSPRQARAFSFQRGVTHFSTKMGLI